jgi:hypothetical protein
MRWETWMAFAILETAQCLTPGPAVPFLLSQALARGMPSSIWANLGILAANTIYFILSAAGLGAILLASYDLFSAIRWIGAAYLIYLGISAFIGNSQMLSVATRRETGERPANLSQRADSSGREARDVDILLHGAAAIHRCRACDGAPGRDPRRHQCVHRVLRARGLRSGCGTNDASGRAASICEADQSHRRHDAHRRRRRHRIFEARMSLPPRFRIDP